MEMKEQAVETMMDSSFQSGEQLLKVKETHKMIQDMEKYFKDEEDENTRLVEKLKRLEGAVKEHEERVDSQKTAIERLMRENETLVAAASGAENTMKM